MLIGKMGFQDPVQLKAQALRFAPFFEDALLRYCEFEAFAKLRSETGLKEG